MQARAPKAWSQAAGRPDAVTAPVADGSALPAAAGAVVALASTLLPLLKPGTDGRLPRAVALALLRRALGVSALPPEAELALTQAEPEAMPAAGAFHAASVRAALLSHWSEVRRWNLPAADAEAFVALANEHLRLLDPSDYGGNAMVCDAVRQRIDQALRMAVRGLDREQLRLLPALFEALGLPGGLHDGRLASELAGQVTAPANITAVLEAMTAAGECVRHLRADGRPVYLDPDLVGELAETRQRELALEQRLGRTLVARGAADSAPEPDVQAQVDSFRRRLKTLEGLAAQGIITADEFGERRAEILREI
ncbi:MAG: hypothetical protein HZB16_15085 [Armatimonadetes bacterium]|nr:hypothetical protein [Armatimonadota bacterium]